jgi:hypothetical protein
MLGVIFAKMFNTKIVNCKRESGRTGVVPPHARRDWDRHVTAWSEMLRELVVQARTLASLRPRIPLQISRLAWPWESKCSLVRLQVLSVS